MEREVDFPRIDGIYYGGDQNWYRHWLMRLGGCSTTTACEACICLARQRADLRPLYPGDPRAVTREEFRCFAETMFPYVHPGIGGLTDPRRYALMLRSYAASCGVSAAADVLEGTAPLEAAEAFIRSAVRDGRPVACLVLRHRDPQMDDFEWHWFSLCGHHGSGLEFQVLAANLGRRHVLPLARLWDTGFAWKGGLVSLRRET